MHQITLAIADYNAGRDPERLRRKLALIAADPFAFMRGTCHLFYAGLSALPAAPVLRAAPRVWICGDLHLENFGTFKGDNRLVYFDLNDFDETCLAPFTLDLVRLAASIKVAAQSLRLGAREGHALTALFFASYASEAAAGKARWIERSTAGGMVRDLLRSLKLRTRAQLLDQRTVLRAKRRALRLDGSKALPASTAQRKRAEALLADFAAKRRHPEFFEPMDLARRVAGNGALGMERYIALVRGRGGQSGGPDGNFLMDIKCAAPSALKPRLTGPQPKWESEARRVVTIQTIVQAAPPALLGTAALGGASFLVKELQPAADRLNLPLWNGRIKRLEQVIVAMAQVTAWGHLRGCGRLGAATVEELAAYAVAPHWQPELGALAREAGAKVTEQWHAYAKDFRDGVVKV